MTRDEIEALLASVASHDTDVQAASEQLARLPVENLGFARLDHHRALRQGLAEVIYGEGKTPDQVVALAHALVEAGSDVLCTRVGKEAWDGVRARLPEARYDEVARVFTIRSKTPPLIGRVGVLCAGTSDLPVAEEAAACAAFMGAEVTRLYDIGVAGIHRLLAVQDDLRTIDVAIVVAGMEGALPTVVGGLVACPVIAVPTSVGYGASFGGLAALLAMLNACASGITVVNIDNGFGAAAAAYRILARSEART